MPGNLILELVLLDQEYDVADKEDAHEGEKADAGSHCDLLVI